MGASRSDTPVAELLVVKLSTHSPDRSRVPAQEIGRHCRVNDQAGTVYDNRPPYS